MTDSATVVLDADAHRFVVQGAEDEAFLHYRRRADRLILVHTEVAPELGGRGLASRLVEAAIEFAIEERLTVVPVCPMANGWLHRHPEVAQRVTIDWAQGADD